MGKLADWWHSLELVNDRKPTNELYLLPIFLGLLGGFMMFFIAKKDDMKMATSGLIIGFFVFIIMGIIFRFLLFADQT